MILYINETVIRIKKKHCDITSRVSFLKFTLASPEYTRNIVFFDSYGDFPKY